MLKSKKNIFNAVFIIAVFGLTMFCIFRGEDLGNIFSKVTKASPGYLVLGVICVIVYIYIESDIIHYMLQTLGMETKRFTCFLFSGVGFFFSCITPASTGGQPAQIYYMNKSKIPVPVSTVVLMIVTITFKLVLVVVGLFLIFFQQGFINKYLSGILPIFYLGIALNFAVVAAMMILTFNQKFAKNIMMTGLKILVKLRLVKQKPKRFEKLSKSMDSYNGAAQYLRAHKFVIFRVFFITLVQRFVLFFATYFTYKAFGLHGARIYDIVMLQAVISISVEMLPIPGGMGISEGLFLAIFIPIFGPSLIMPAMILSRGLGYYTQLLLSAAMTCYAHITIIGKNRPVIAPLKDNIRTIECKH